jgi:hypothetical protein
VAAGQTAGEGGGKTAVEEVLQDLGHTSNEPDPGEGDRSGKIRRGGISVHVGENEKQYTEKRGGCQTLVRAVEDLQKQAGRERVEVERVVTKNRQRLEDGGRGLRQRGWMAMVLHLSVGRV